MTIDNTNHSPRVAPAAPKSPRTSPFLAAVFMGTIGVGAALGLAYGQPGVAPATTASVQLADISIPLDPPCIRIPGVDPWIDCPIFPPDPYGGPMAAGGNGDDLVFDPDSGWAYRNGWYGPPPTAGGPEQGGSQSPAPITTAAPAPPPPRDNFGDYGDSGAR